ncbi:MAG TPA: histidine kinase [Saprospiraceae bacterium]|nr:histidine kinase [Saprospiraceae bacterium]MCB9269462.1 histidine kinase [Lewinellaceae bacterium]HPG06916.1 histidine kinase [Saprospiraceae bacterium]HQU55563.1 histidine kinase [Saprospiraceae bacterium]HRV85154.1 histidine kinase [Saprospiraceae bacterium]
MTLTKVIRRSAIGRFIAHPLLRHGLGWLVIFLVLRPLAPSAISNLPVLFFLMAGVYINIYLLIPTYLSKNFLFYTLMLLGLCLLITPINTAVYSMVSGIPMGFSAMVMFFLTFFFVTGTTTITKIIRDYIKQQSASKEIETSQIQTELKFLKSQINPHFLFNTLNNLYALTLKKSDAAPEIVIKLSEMLRYMLYECNERRVLLSKEIKYIRNYLDLELLRQGNKANITFEVEGEISDQKIAPLMFIPFLENAFKHGLNRGISHGFVRILMHVEGTKLHFEIENSKPPALPNPEVRKVGGIGLMNVKRRLNLIYPQAYALNIEDKPDAYTVLMDLNLEIL